MYIRGMNDMQWTRQGVDFACDEKKQQLNLHKHGVDLLDASTAFFDPCCLSFFDTEHNEMEDRHQLLAKMTNGKLVFVVYTVRNDVVRLISARKAQKKEAQIYEQQ